MNKFIVKLECGNHAIIQSCNMSDIENVKATIGIILPNRRFIKFFELNNWIASYKGHSLGVKISLIKIYNKNKTVIKKKVTGFATS